MATNGLLRVVSGDDLDARAAPENVEQDDSVLRYGIVNHVRAQWEIMRNHRESAQIDERLLRSLRVFNGEYEPGTLAEIRKFGGSEVYSRVVGTKARGATALLRDIYFSSERPWALEPTANPVLPDNIMEMIPRLVQIEVQQAMMTGEQVTQEAMSARVQELMGMAMQAQRETAKKEAEKAELHLEDFLQEGGYYKALAEILIDIPLFPFVVMKGPVVRMADDIVYQDGRPVAMTKPKLFWERVSPFDFYWMPGAKDVKYSPCIERLRWTRKDLNDLIGLPGWNEDQIRMALEDYRGGLRDFHTGVDHERAMQEDREDPTWNQSDMIDALEYHGSVSGHDLVEIGFTEYQVPDPTREYSVAVWLCGNYLLKTQINPNPRKRHPYNVTSFEKVPGTPMGHALPDMLSDIGDVANAAMRNLVNNMSMASGPQVVVNTDRIASEEDAATLYPWKRWYVEDDELANRSRPPVEFFQPNSNAAELLGIYQRMTEIADEISAIPRYITGSGAPGGAGRTASGLSMLMGNASKVLQQVAHNIDMDLLHGTLQQLYDLLMVADSGVTLRGDENIVVKGVNKVLAKEVERARQLEFLGLTANPIDMQITGIEGRAAVLRAVASDLNLPAGEAVPPAEVMAQRQQQALAASQAQAQAEAQGNGDAPPQPGGGDQQVTNTVQPNLNLRGN